MFFQFSLFLIVFQAFVTYFTLLILNYTVELIFALIFSLTISNTVKYIVENKQKSKLNKALSEYVSKDIASEILSWAGKINLDGENKEVTVFFSDIEWFTTISELFSPEELVYPNQKGEVCASKPKNKDDFSAKLDCKSGYGAAMHITATFGLVAASSLIQKIITKK